MPSVSPSAPIAAGTAGAPGGVLLDVERVEQGLDSALSVYRSRQAGVLAPVRRRSMTWVIAQRTREADEEGR